MLSVAGSAELHPSEAAKPAGWPPEFLTVADLAVLMRVSRETAYLWCRSGDVPARQIRGTWRIRRRDIEEMFEM